MQASAANGSPDTDPPHRQLAAAPLRPRPAPEGLDLLATRSQAPLGNADPGSSASTERPRKRRVRSLFVRVFRGSPLLLSPSRAQPSPLRCNDPQRPTRTAIMPNRCAPGATLRRIARNASNRSASRTTTSCGPHPADHKIRPAPGPCAARATLRHASKLPDPSSRKSPSRQPPANPSLGTAARGSPRTRVKAGTARAGLVRTCRRAAAAATRDGSAPVFQGGDEGRDGGVGLRAEGGE